MTHQTMQAPTQICRWHAFPATGELDRAAAREILRCARQAIARSGKFSIVLAGGSTPRQVYRLLRSSGADWPRWHVYFGDERCLPPHHPERNSRMAAESWLDHVTIPPGQVHPIPAELGAERAAAAYAKTLETAGEFDLVLLGLGEDGHTASLFPGREWGTGHGAPSAMAVFDAPKPPAQRVSLSAARLSRAHEVMFLVSGAGKRQAVADWRAGEAIPAGAVAPRGGVDVFLDEGLVGGAVSAG